MGIDSAPHFCEHPAIMKFSAYTKHERTFIGVMRVWIVLFLGAAILFAALPHTLLVYLDDIGRGIFGWHSPPLPEMAEHFWQVLAVSMLAVIGYLCAIAQHQPDRNIGYARPVILSKFVTTVGFALCLIFGARHFFALVGVTVDGLILLITWYVYHKARWSRS